MNVKEYHLLAAKPKRSKYRNIPAHFDGLLFASKREGFRWIELRQMERDGEITNLKRQVVFPLVANGQLICKYHADYVYERNGKRVVEDSKGGIRTDVYRLKKKLMFVLLGIEILET